MADLVSLETNIMAYWKANQIYRKLKARNAGGPKFYFVDGPPYATGQIHPGTAWNKCLKDSFLRYWRARGFNVRDQPGFDTHGLPIEVKVEQELKIANKKEIESKIGVAKFIAECKRFATQYIGVISTQFERCGGWMDWERPYVTYHDSYIEAIWRTIQAAERKSLLTPGHYVVPQCVRCETTLANYELEYEEETDPSIYVKFKVKDTPNEFLVIWTTTPWTLVGNMGVMVHPTHSYVKVKVREEVWIVAKERLDAVMAFEPLVSPILLGETSGKKLEGLRYEHPLQSKIGHDYERKVVLSDEFVTMEDGSGLVHCAPGHGPEDFIVGRRAGIPLLSPVDAAGLYTAEAGQYVGRSARESNSLIISDLETCGALIHQGQITHRYPHCWRCHSPLIFIATNQWFVSISKLKERMLEEVDKNIRFQPDFAKTRFRDFVSSAPDWCISRQRYWGAPLPIWVCEKKECGKRKVIGSKAELLAGTGAGPGAAGTGPAGGAPTPAAGRPPVAAFVPSAPDLPELHRPFIDSITLACECGGTMRRVPDILDVWFDSGTAAWAQLGEAEAAAWSKNGQLQAEFITEGKDQTRGWFYSLLGCGMVLNNESPYKTVLMHGFFVDEKGEKMSKSVGNFVPLEEILGKYGADAFRLWGLSATVWDDLRFSYRELDERKRVLDIVLNVGSWMAQSYKPAGKLVEEADFEPEDRWLRSRTQGLIEKVSQSFEGYAPHEGLYALQEFLVEDVSRFYLKRLKQRLGEDRKAAAGLFTLYESLLTAVQLLYPYAPFTAEHLYLAVFKPYVKEDSVSFLAWPAPNPAWRDPLLETQMTHARVIVNAAANARAKANLKLRWPAEHLCISSSSTEVKNAAERLSDLIAALCNVRHARLAPPQSKFDVSLDKTKIGAKFKGDSPAVLAALAKLAPEQILEGLRGPQPWKVENKWEIEPAMASVSETAEGYALAPFDSGTVYVCSVMDDALYSEGLGREIGRRMQMMRKEMGLSPGQPVDVWLAGAKELLSAAEKQMATLQSTVSAKTIHLKGHSPADALVKEWEIEEMKLKIAMAKL